MVLGRIETAGAAAEFLLGVVKDLIGEDGLGLPER